MSNYVQSHSRSLSGIGFPGGGPKGGLGGCSACGAADTGSNVGALLIVGVVAGLAWMVMKKK